MKTIVLLENGLTQLVLTPENDFEKKWVASLRDKKVKATQYIGIYHCQGGWVREQDEKDSLMFVFVTEDK